MGVKFKSDVSTSIVGIRFYKSAANTGTHVGNLWSAAGTLLATGTFTNETASGWQQLNFSTPVPITANTVYVASYHSTTGHYAADQNFFATEGVDNAPLHALQDGVSGTDGVFTYGTNSAFPSTGYLATNYWVDVVLTLPPALNSITVTPANSTVAVGGTQQFTANGLFTDGSTQNITNQVTWSSSNSSVATISSSGVLSALTSGSSVITASQGSVSATTNVTTQIMPLAVTTASLAAATADLPYSTQVSATGGQPPYTWSLASGSTLPNGLAISSAGQISGSATVPGSYSFTVQVKDLNSTAATKLLTMSVANTPTSSFSIWPSTTTPTVSDGGADGSVELGVQFTSNANGSIAGIRFYKSAANVGPHVVNLWNSAGTLLATATSSNETASGWQQVNFSSPVPVTANTVYVASYHVSAGHYAADQNYFATSGVVNLPLQAPQNTDEYAEWGLRIRRIKRLPQLYPTTPPTIGLTWPLCCSPSLDAISVTPANPTDSGRSPAADDSDWNL